MYTKSANRSSYRVSKNLPLRIVIIAPFIFQIFIVVGLVGYLSYKNGQRAINDVATQLLDEITARVEQNLQAYLAIPHKVNQINAAAIDLNQLNLQDSSSLERHFWQQIQIFDSLTFAGLGLEQKDNLGAERLDDGKLAIRTSTKDSSHIFRTYSTNQFGDRQKLLDSIPFDPRTRPWYKAAVTAKQETWSKIYPNTAGITSYLGASKPFYHKQGRLLGVLLTNVNLSQIGEFLGSLTIGKNGQAFVIERSGMLVATSTGEKPLRTINKQYGAQRVKATNSKNALTKTTAQYLATNVEYEKLTQKSQQLEYKIEGKRHFIQLQPFQDEFGLDWLIVVVVPETDFIGQIRDNTRTTIMLCITASVVAAIVGLLTYRWILQPILRLNTAAKAIASGEWEETVDIQRSDELGELAKSFNNMAFQLKKFFASLEAKNVKLRQLRAETLRQNIELWQVKDKLTESNHNLEQKVSERTQELSQTLKILKATQAQLVFENKLLRSAEPTSTHDYQVGGSLPMDTPYYVVRSADHELHKALKQRKFCYILNARQMGKSSLMVRMMHHLRQDGYCCTAIDMTRISGERITPEQWYKGLVVELWQGFNLCEKINLKHWWHERQDLSLIQRLSQFIEYVLLVETRGNDDSLEPPIVICFDEIDSVLSLDFSINDFFALIRFCYNQRSLNPKYQRLTFALFGVATPSDLINDYRRTPFNIGQAIQLEGFNLHEAQPLLVGLKEKTSNSQLLFEVLAWTNGQPFLTQKLCQLIRSDSVSVPTDNLSEWLEQFVRNHMINNWQSQDEPEHLKTIRDRLLSDEEKTGCLLALYQQILQRGFVHADNSIGQQELLLSGLIIKQKGKLKVRNRIYQKVFNLVWVEAQLSQLRPYSEALQAWQKSIHTDTSRLLRGKALQDAQKWSRGKSLSDLDYRFLASSEELDRKETQQALEAERAQEIEARLQEKQKRLAQEQKTAQLQSYFLAALSFAFLIALGLGAIAYKHYRQAAFSEIKALDNYSTALFASNQRLQALITAIKVKQKWQQLDYEDENTDKQIESVLRQSVYGVDEYNRLSGHTEVVFGVNISPNGQLIATGSSDRTVKLWKPDGTLINTFQGHQAAVWDVAFSPDGKTIASASRDYTVKLWHQDGRLLNTLKGHQDEVVGISFSLDGQTMASASRDHTVKLWDRDGNVIDTLSGHQSSVWKAVFSPDGQMIATASEDKTVKLWKIDTRGRFKLDQTLRGHSDEIRDVAFSPDGQTIASVSHDQTAKLWEASSGKLLHTLEEHSSPVLGVVFSPDNQIVATTGWDGMVKVFNLEGALLKTINIDKKRIWDIDISPDGKSIATASEQDLVKLSKLDNPLLKVLRSHNAPIIDVAFNPQGNIIATASDDRTVKLWSKNGLLLTTFESKQDSVLGIAWNPDTHRLVSGHWNGAINFLRVKNLNSPQIHLDKTIPGHKVGVWRIAVSPNGKLIATASEDKTAKIWDWQGNLITSLIGHQDVVRAVAFSPDNKIVATASYDKTVKLWNTQGKIIATLKKNNNDLGAGALNISPDGNMMATADLEGTIKLWQIEQEQDRVSVKLNKTLKSHTEEVRKIIFSPNGQLIASASEDNTIKIWHHSGELLKTFYGHEAAVWSLAFSPDGKTLASVSEDKTVIIWNLQQMFQLNLLAAGCRQIEDYLRTNAEISPSDRLICEQSDRQN
jgi:WD40 repeat protein/HAMP domain-containing protein